MSIASIETRKLLKVENRLRCRDQTKAIGLEESDEHVLLGNLIRFVENSDKSIPQIAELMGVSGVALSMWIAGTAMPSASKLLEIKRLL
jgi:transcriptional regulator with XRE-family HTH domain